MTSIVLISGSHRRDSVNNALLATARRVIGERDASVRTTVLDPRTLPFYDQDLDAEGAPSTVATARELVGAADAVLIATPEYNGAPPGVLKNAVDWLTRPWGEHVLKDMPVATVSASVGSDGAAGSQQLLREVLECGRALLVDHPFLSVGEADLLSREAGEFADPDLIPPLTRVVDALLAAARARAADRTDDTTTQGPLQAAAGTSAA